MPARRRCLALGMRAGRRSAHRLSRDRVDPTEDHSPGAGLKHAGDSQFERFTEVIGSLLGDDHGSVVQVADPLPLLLTALEQLDRQALTGKNDRLHGVGKVVQVDDFDPLQPSDLVEVIVVGHDLPAEVFCQNNQPLVDFADARELWDLGIMDPDFDSRRFLEPVEDVEPAPAPVPPKLVGAVGDTLKLLEHEARNDELLVDDPGLGDVGDAAVDDHRRIEHERACSLDLFGKLDVRDDEAKVVLGLQAVSKCRRSR